MELKAGKSPGTDEILVEVSQQGGEGSAHRELGSSATKGHARTDPRLAQILDCEESWATDKRGRILFPSDMKPGDKYQRGLPICA